jgi:hypothetical protein
MTSLLQVVAIVVSVVLLVIVLELVRRRKLTEEHSFIWIACALALLALSIWRGLIDTVAVWLGIAYGPAVLLLVVILFGFVGALYVSVVLSQHRDRIEQLVEDVAILEAKLREMEKRDGT